MSEAMPTETATALRLERATREDMPDIRYCHAMMLAWLGGDEELVPIPEAGLYPVIESLKVVNERGEVEGAVFFELNLECQMVAKTARAAAFIAESQAIYRAHLDEFGFGQVAIRSFVPVAAAIKMRHLLKRAHLKAMDDLYRSFVHVR